MSFLLPVFFGTWICCGKCPLSSLLLLAGSAFCFYAGDFGADVNKASLSQVGEALWPKVPLNWPYTTSHATAEICVHVCDLVTEWDNGTSSGTIKTSLLEEGLTEDHKAVEVWVVGGQAETGKDRVLCRTWPPHAPWGEEAEFAHSNPLSMDGKLYFIETGKN